MTLAWPCFSMTGHLAMQGQTHGNGSPLKIALRWHGTYQWLRKRVLVEGSVGRSLTSCRLWAPKRGFEAAEALPQAEELNVTRSALVNAQRLIKQVCHHLCPHLRLLHNFSSETARGAGWQPVLGLSFPVLQTPSLSLQPTSFLPITAVFTSSAEQIQLFSTRLA